MEDLLGKRFNGSTLEETLGVKSGKTGEKKMETEKEIDHSPTQTAEILLPPSPFRDLIAVSFKPYLDIYIDSIDRNLNELVEKFLQMSKPAIGFGFLGILR